MRFLQGFTILLTLAAAPVAAQPNACQETPSTLVTLRNSVACDLCGGRLLPGAAEPSREARFTIHSDLPEIFGTPGVLYATTPVLPPFQTNNGTEVPLSQRTQTNNGFTAVTGDFEVFVFHITQPGDGSQPRRVAVYAHNRGTSEVTIQPRQVMQTDGVIANIHEMESTLGRRVLGDDWDRPIPTVTIPPGQGAVVGYSKTFGIIGNGVDRSQNTNCFGILRAAVMGDNPQLDVYTVGVPATPRESLANITTKTRNLLTTGAKSNEDSIDLLTAPSGCQLRRVVGVFSSFRWRSERVTLDVGTLPAAPAQPILFQMGLPWIQSRGCPTARQTQPMLLHPPYVWNDTVGNYMTEYRVDFRVINKGNRTRRFNVQFGKTGADIGLAWQVVTRRSGGPASDDDLIAAPVQTGWAGPFQEPRGSVLNRSFFPEGRGPVLGPCEGVDVAIRFIVLGNSSLPFTINALAEDGEFAGNTYYIQ